jgi:very-short-patch-repair endonuclease
MGNPAPRNEEMRSTLSEVRKELLDFGLRNPLLNYRPLKSRGLTITSVTPSDVFRILVEEARDASFAPSGVASFGTSIESEKAIKDSPQAALDLRGSRRVQNRPEGLPTCHSADEMDNRLLATYYAAKSSIDEQGVNTLYVALGFLSWADPAAPLEFHLAPLILMPIELERKSAAEGFKAKYNGEDILPNVCLLEFMKQSHGIEIEPYAESEDLDVEGYFQRVVKAVSHQSGWSVDADSIAVGFFSFAKFLMYRDLDPTTWGKNDDSLLQHGILNRLLGGKYFTGDASSFKETDFVDDHLQRNPIQTVVDADSTQMLALLDVDAGTSMVVQGPPGTGKSQTIVNLIAQALATGKTVLFVSEKKAALDVVKQRLDRVGLGAACLELHSNKVKKKSVIEELKRTSGFRSSTPQNGRNEQPLLQESKSRLDRYCAAVNNAAGNSQESVRDLYGVLLPVLARLKEVEIPDINLPDCETWSLAEVDRKRRKLQQVQDCLRRCSIPQRHAFWGTQLRVVLPSTTDGIRRALTRAATVSQDLAHAVQRLSDRLGQGIPKTSTELAEFCATARLLLDAPELHGIEVGSDSWTEQADTIKQSLNAGERLSAIRTKWDSTIRDTAWSIEVKPLEMVLTELQHKWWRSFSPRWRNAKAQVAELINTSLAKETVDIVAIPEAIRTASELTAELSAQESLLAGLFAEYWDGTTSQWKLLDRQFQWIISARQGVSSGRLHAWCHSAASRDVDRVQVRAALSDCERILSERQQAFGQIIELLKLDVSQNASIAKAMADLTLSEAEGFWGEKATRIGELEELVRFLQARDECAAEKLASIPGLSESWTPASQHLVDLFDYSRVSQLLNKAFTANPILAQFDGALHSGWVQAFRDTDAGELQRSRASLAERHAASIPRSASANGQLGVLMREFEKKARHLAVRQLISKAGNAIQAIKPVFMMSPLSVANYLPPGTVEFDLVVFDEASQVRPPDALGAIVRGKQTVVVGDSKQLPPTSFFDTMVAGDEVAEEDEVPATSDIESVLGLFCSRGAHQRMLRWHYRSRHESLIAGSNHLFYDDKLVVFPSPDREKQSVGLVYRRVTDGAYDRSRTRTNKGEAKAVALAAMEHAQRQMHLPREERMTLGVAALSVAQRDAILNELELLRRKTPAYEEFFSEQDEQFFVKNLENVQGDERDVIFISIGYGRTAEGYLSMGFGPVNRAGGERRLNVLFSRARRRCEVFTTLSSADIETSRNNSEGLSALKTFLHYAEHGQLDLPVFTGGPPQSPFEEQVLRALQGLGHTVHTQVGSAGFFLDLAIVDPRRPGRYLLGIECDGAAYHSARSTRDRDRLRQAVLISMGWSIHRVWSTSWFRNPEGELQALQAAIESALDGIDGATGPKVEPNLVEPRIESEPIAKQPSGEPHPNTTRVIPKYTFAELKIEIGKTELHLVPATQLSAWLAEIVEVEGPIHWLEATRRIASAAGVHRVGNRIQDAFKLACISGSRRNVFIYKDNFLKKGDEADAPIRDRSEFPPQLKKLEYVAPEEIHAAIELAVNESFGLDEGDVANSACRLLGFSRVTEEMRATVEAERDYLVAKGRLVMRGEVLVCDGTAKTDSETIGVR